MMSTNLLTKSKCLDFLREFETPDHVVAHCIAVANVGKKIGEALNKTGFSMDTQLIETAGLLHDMARTDDKHWEVSADFLKQRGFEQEADIIRVHMHHLFPEDCLLSTETDMVCLADRLVLENHYVGLHIRMDYIIKKAGDQPEIIRRIQSNKVLVGEYIAKLEQLLGTTIESIVQEQNKNEQI
jgi:putative nucleotidyltransferase with HDIG domain